MATRSPISAADLFKEWKGTMTAAGISSPEQLASIQMFRDNGRGAEKEIAVNIGGGMFKISEPAPEGYNATPDLATAVKSTSTTPNNSIGVAGALHNHAPYDWEVQNMRGQAMGGYTPPTPNKDGGLQGYSDPGFTGGSQYNNQAKNLYNGIDGRDPSIYGAAVANFARGAWQTAQPIINELFQNRTPIGDSPEQALLRERATEIEQRAAEQRAEADTAEADWRREENVMAAKDINTAANSAAQLARQQLGGAAGAGAAAAAGAQQASQAAAQETPAAIQRARQLKYQREQEMVGRRQAAEQSRATGSQVRQQMVSSQNAYADWVRREREKNQLQRNAANSTGAGGTPGPTDALSNMLKQHIEQLEAQIAAGNTSPWIQQMLDKYQEQLEERKQQTGGSK